jgi:hypothetical protein
MIANRLGDRHLFLAQLAPSWTNWHWGPDCKIIRRSENNPERIEECNDKEHLEGALKSLFEIRQQYDELAQKSKPSRAKELNNGVRDKDKQIAWVEEKLEALRQRSLCDEFSVCPSCASQTINPYDGCALCGGSRSQFLEDKCKPEISSRKIPNSSQFLEDKSEEKISSRNRRRKGDGSGCIYWRTVTKKGKSYQEAYYQYEFWKEGSRLVKSSKYIPKRLLASVLELDAQKAPVREILKLLGVTVCK